MSVTDRLESMLAGGRDDAMLRFGLGSAYFNDGDHARAARHLKACIAFNENYSAAYKLLGKALFKSEDYEGAQAVLSKGITVASAQGDKQSEREMTVFLAKTEQALSSRQGD